MFIFFSYQRDRVARIKTITLLHVIHFIIQEHCSVYNNVSRKECETLLLLCFNTAVMLNFHENVGRIEHFENLLIFQTIWLSIKYNLF